MSAAEQTGLACQFDAPAVHRAARPLRVLVWSPGGMGEFYHGPAISTYRVFQHIRRQHEVDVCLVHGCAQQGQQALAFEVRAMPRVDGEHHPARRYLRQLAFLIRSEAWLRGNAPRFDVLYAPAANILTLRAVALAEKLGLPAVCRVAAAGNDFQNRDWARSLLNFADRRARMISRASCVIALSRQIEEELRGRGLAPDKVVNIPNSADCERFLPAGATARRAARRRLSVPEDARVVLCVGAVCDRKGQHLIAAALAGLGGDLHLLAVGPIREPEYLRRIERICEHHSMSHRFHHQSFLQDVEIAYQAADLFVLPSSDEGMPNALVEAMASGLPCIGTPISGIVDLIGEEERGLLVPRDAARIGHAVERYFEDAALRKEHSRAARDFVLAHQSSEAVAARLFQVLQSVARFGNGLS